MTRETPLATTLLALLVIACGSGGGGGSDSELAGAAAPLEAFSISGIIRAAPATAIDGDVNDPGASRDSNDTFGAAQEIPNPVTLGGYVNQPGFGEAGVSFAAGDVRDYFRTSLAAGETVRLISAGDGLFDDLDLGLLELDGTPVASSDGNTPLELVSAPASNDYLIEVSAFSGASNYVLTVGPSGAAGASSVASTPEFVPGEVVVRFREGTGVAASSLGLTRVAEGPSGESLLACRGPSQRDAAFHALGISHLVPKDPGEPLLSRRARLERDTRRLVKALRRRVDVVEADLNYVRRPTAMPSDEFHPLQWNHSQINLPPAWDNVAPVSSVVVAVIDTGVAQAHPDLQSQLVPGYDFISNPQISVDGGGCDPSAEDPGDGFTPGASSYHGTHVAGIVAARTSLQPAGNEDGVAGVAWNARVMPLRVLGRGGGTDFDIMQAIRFAAGMTNACGVLPPQPADVINLSLGGAGFSSVFESLIADVRAAGIPVIAAAGNESSSTPFYPAAYAGVISVSAVNADENLAPYSNFGGEIDVAAPGGDLTADLNADGFPDGVLSTLYAGETGEFIYAFSEGTSMAAPHVSGVIALMLGVNPALNPFDIDALLDSGALTRDIGSSFLFGNGLIDAFAAISAAFTAQGGSPPVNDPRLRVDPIALAFGSLGTEAEIGLSNSGGDGQPLVVLSVTSSTDDGAAWLSVSADSIDANGLGEYRVSVDRAQVLADGIYTGTVSLSSSANDVDIPVAMEVGSAVRAPSDAGHHFVLLIDADSLETRQGLSTTAQGGEYGYRFNNVAPGRYLIITGTDSDNDFLICDAGEACGAFPVLDGSQPIDVAADLTGMDFATGFPSQVSAAAASPTRWTFTRLPARN